MYLTPEQHRALHDLSVRTGRSMSDLVREMLQTYLFGETPPTDLSDLAGAVEPRYSTSFHLLEPGVECSASFSVAHNGRQSPREVTRGGQVGTALAHLHQLLQLGSIQVVWWTQHQPSDAPWRRWGSTRLRWRRPTVT